MILRIIFSFCLVLSLTGCASLGTYNPATGKKEFIFISTSDEILMGRDIHRKISRNNKVIRGTTQAARLERIGQRVARVSDRQDYQYKFFLIDKKDMNAFTTPGGNIYLYKGLMEQLITDDQIASVLAHEIGHCAARHTVKKFQAALGVDLLQSLIFGQLGAAQQQTASLSSNMLMNIVFSSYGRQDEYESDRLGVKYMYLAGYDLNGIIEAFEVLKREAEGSQGLLILRSHPFLDDRIKEVKKEIPAAAGRYGKGS